MTRLLYVRQSVTKLGRLPAPRQGFDFVPYREELLPTFLDVLEQSYDGSLDCPELNGVRRLEDVLASHRGPGPFNSDSWFLVRDKQGWLGCLLLTAAPDRSIEVAYLAVLKSARGRGLGKELTRHALRHAAARKLDAVVLAVDSRNWPALAMYESEGFLPWDAREVYLLLLDPANAAHTIEE
jgi:ribosomal protein S18 acetylase RimI-like enzyme